MSRRACIALRKIATSTTRQTLPGNDMRKPRLRLFKVDDVPDGIQVLDGRLKMIEGEKSGRAYIDFHILVLRARRRMSVVLEFG
jgi:hypothetical protein